MVSFLFIMGSKCYGCEEKYRIYVFFVGTCVGVCIQVWVSGVFVFVSKLVISCRLQE